MEVNGLNPTLPFFFVYRWQVLSSDIAPFNMLSSSCLGLPNDEVLILGSNYLDGAKKSAIYNLANDTWTLLGKKLKMYWVCLQDGEFISTHELC